MECSIIVIETPGKGALEYLYPSGNGYVMVVYGDPRKRQEMLNYLDAALREVAAATVLRATVWSYEASSVKDMVEVLKEVFVPDWARKKGPEWASRVAIIPDTDKVFDRILKDVRQNGIPGMVIELRSSQGGPA